MPTNEERKALAKRLRVLASHAPADADMVLDALDLYPGEYIEGFDPRCVERLADLIEPEERTCRNVGYYSDSTRFECSECEFNGWVKWAKDGKDRVPGYCPNCGAKAVEQ